MPLGHVLVLHQAIHAQSGPLAASAVDPQQQPRGKALALNLVLIPREV